MKVCPKCGKQYGDDANFCTADAGRLIAGASTTPAAPAAGPADAGLIGGRFALGERIGGGATGDVHRATDRQAGGPVALKLIDPALTSQAAVAQRIERELKLLERVQSPAVAKVLASGKHGDRLWVASEWIEGAMPLGDAIASGVIETARAGEIALAVGAALVEAAKVGVVHRDLAPKNVLLGADGVKVINFPLPVPGPRVAGVPGFVSPEAIEGKPIDQRSATYSLGAIYYAALTGAPPFQGEAQAVHAAQLTGSIQPPSQKVPLAPEIDSLVGRAMERNPAKRYLTLKQFLDDIERVKNGGAAELAPGSTAPFGRVGKPKEMASTILGVGKLPAGGMAVTEQKTRQMDVEIPAEALREAAAFDAPPAPAPAPVASVTPPRPATPPAGVMPVAAPAMTHPPVPAPPPTHPPVAVAPPPAVAAHPPAAHPMPAPAAAAYVEPPRAAAAPAPAPMAAAAASSPWAPPTVAPGQGAPAMSVAAPAPAAPPAGPAAPAAAQSMRSTTKGNPGGKNKPESKGKKKGQFRETMWFKKGDLDAAAAEEAAKAKDGSGQDKVDSLPMEERYSDDGTITRSDAERYSLKTGQTTQMPAFENARPPGSSVSEGDLIGEMKSGRKTIFIAIGVGVVVIIAIVLAFAL